MKPFDLESAKAGAKVVTRCGYPARILCFDLNDDRKLAVAIDRGDGCGEMLSSFPNDGKHYSRPNSESKYDLFMDSEKRYMAVWLTDKGTAAVHPAVFASVEQLYAVMTGMTGVQIVEFEL